MPGIAIVSGQIFVCGGEVDSKILANGEVRILASDWSCDLNTGSDWSISLAERVDIDTF